jgi:hypothetical protein
VLPTRVPTVVPGSQPGAVPAVPVSAQNAPSAASAASAGGLTLPTRVPTVAAGQPAPVLPTAAPAASPALAAEPETLPQFALYFLLAAAMGLAIFPVVWDRQTTPRDRRFGVVWALVVSYGGAVWAASLLKTVLGAPVDNAVIGPGVGGVSGVMPALWELAAAFALGAAALTVAWLPNRAGSARTTA